MMTLEECFQSCSDDNLDGSWREDGSGCFESSWWTQTDETDGSLQVRLSAWSGSNFDCIMLHRCFLYFIWWLHCWVFVFPTATCNFPLAIQMVQSKNILLVYLLDESKLTLLTWNFRCQKFPHKECTILGSCAYTHPKNCQFYTAQSDREQDWGRQTYILASILQQWKQSLKRSLK